MESVALHIGLTPLAFALAARAQNRFGAWMGGRLLGLPLTTGPFLLAVLLLDGRASAAGAATGVVSGQISVIVFCAAYARQAAHQAHDRPAPGRTLVVALAAGLAAVAAFHLFGGVVETATATLVATALCLRGWPRPVEAASTGTAGDTAGLAGRAIAATAIVAGTSTLVSTLGAWLAGVLSSAPVLLATMLPRLHRRDGAAAARAMARGTISSMPGTVVFAAVLATTLTRLPALASWGLALAALVTITALGASGVPSCGVFTRAPQ